MELRRRRTTRRSPRPGRPTQPRKGGASGGAAVDGPTWWSSQAFVSALARHTPTIRSPAAGVPSQSAGGNLVMAARLLRRNSTTRGWSRGLPRGAVLSPGPPHVVSFRSRGRGFLIRRRTTFLSVSSCDPSKCVVDAIPGVFPDVAVRRYDLEEMGRAGPVTESPAADSCDGLRAAPSEEEFFASSLSQ